MSKTKILVSIAISIFIILSIFTYINITKQKRYIENKKVQSFDVMQQMIDGKIIFLRKQFSSRLKSALYHNENFKIAFQSQDEKKIDAILNKLFIRLKYENRYTKSLRVYNNDNVLIFNSNKFTKSTINNLNIIKFVNRTKRGRYGFEFVDNTINYVVALPLIYNKKKYGVMQYDIDPSIFINDISSVSNYIESTILINQNIIQHNGKKSNIKITQSKYALIQNNPFFKDINLNMIKENMRFKKDGQHYISFLYDLLGYDATQNGKFLIAVNMSADQNLLMDMIQMAILNLIILQFIIFLIVYYAFSYYEKKIKIFTEHEKQNERVLQQQSKMSSLTEMIGNIAHHWRQPLSVISTIASGIQVQKEYGVFDEKTLNSSMDSIIEQSSILTKTIDSFGEFFKSDRDKTSFELTDELDKSIALIDATFEINNIKIITNIESGLYLTGFQNEFTQMLLHIFNNAKDQLLKIKTNRYLKIDIFKEDNHIKIEVIDNAGGVPIDIIDKIFEPYFTTKHQSQGTGLGLFIAHETIHKHFNGSIKVENRNISFDGNSYRCAVFIIELPFDKENQQ